MTGVKSTAGASRCVDNTCILPLTTPSACVTNDNDDDDDDDNDDAIHCMQSCSLCPRIIGNESVPKIIINDTINLFLNGSQHFDNIRP